MGNRLKVGGNALKKKGYLGSFTKMTVLFDLILISTVVFLTMFTARGYVSVVKEQEIAIGREKTEELANYFQGKCDRVDGLVRYMHSSDFSGIMSKISENPEAFYEYDNISFMSVFLSAVHSADRDFSDIIIVTADDAIKGHSYSFTEKGWAEIDAGFRFMELPEAQQLLNSEDNDIIIYDDPSEYCLKPREPVISFMGKIYDTEAASVKKVVGLYILNLPVETLDSVLPDEGFMNLASLKVINSWGNIIYARPQGGEGEAYILEEDNNKVYRIEKELSEGELTVCGELPEKMLYAEVRRVQIPIFLVCVLAILLTMILSALISRYFSRRIGLLTDSMLEVEKGDLSVRIPEEGNDEIASLSRSFNVMCEKLEGYIDSVYEAELQRKNAEINALQMQINPHFLYNTLESIKAVAVKEGDERTPEMIVLLGNMFRMISRTDERFVTIEDELEYINTYLMLQSYRYDEVFDIDVKVDETDLEYGIPKLTLQPVIENIIRHGFDGIKRQGIVGVTIKHRGENLEITVYDNGQGMDNERLLELRQKLKSDENDKARALSDSGRKSEGQTDFEAKERGSGIGILNVHHRLRLLFGDEYGISISSIIDMGTAVKIVIPALSPEEMNNVQIDDRG